VINPTNSNRDNYSQYRQQRHSAKEFSFADLLKASSAVRAGGTQIQRSAVVFGAKEESLELPSWMGRLGELVVTEEEALRRAWKAAEPTYPKSIYDLSPEQYAKASQDAKEAAYYYVPTEGKTKLEIYNEIHDIYASYLGEDFRAPQLLGWRLPMDQGSHEYNIRNSEFDFQSSVEMHGANGRYDGMSQDEVRRAIRDQYPKDMTLRDCLMMSQDLHKEGLDNTDIGDSYADEIIGGIMFTMGNGDAAKMILQHMLDMPADYDAMKNSFELFEQNDRTTELPTDMEGVFQRLCSWAGWDEGAGDGILEMLQEMEKQGKIAFNEYGFLVDVKPGNEM
jgi:hypothetical protein